jgi:hypothetical protein
VLSPEGRLLKNRLVYGLPQGSCGIVVDRGGNVYVGSAMKPRGAACPAYIRDTGVVPLDASAAPWEMSSGEPSRHFAESGCLVKFPPSGGSMWWLAEREKGTWKTEPLPWVEAPDAFWRIRDFQVSPVRVKGAEWCRFGISPQLQGNGGIFQLPHGVHCVCRSSRLEMDDFGRIYAPDALTFCVRVFDSEGSQILRVGSYGNADSRGPDSPVPDPPIGTCGVRFAAASDSELYLSDEGNSRILRVRLTYRAEERVPISSSSPRGADR